MTRKESDAGLVRDVHMPRPPFLFHLDQVAAIVQVSEFDLRSKYVFLQNHNKGVPNRHELLAHNIAPIGEPAEWRISETEVLRWMRIKGFRPTYTQFY